jgi:hypothetical protein
LRTLSPLLKKLRYKANMRVYLVDAPSGYEAEVRNADVERLTKLAGEVDLVHAFFTRIGQVQRVVPKLVRHLSPKGLVWLSYPKAKQLATDLNRDILAVIVRPIGLEAVAIVSLDAVWSALRCKVVHAR